jgi:uncharacterized protein YydD (DUF2326 family)
VHSKQRTDHSLRRKDMEFIWEYIAISIPNRIKQNYKQRREVARLIAEQRESVVSIVDKIKNRTFKTALV